MTHVVDVGRLDPDGVAVHGFFITPKATADNGVNRWL
jgi:hypothetical protein